MNLKNETEFGRRLFSVPEAAEHLRISRTMIFKLLREGKLTPTKIGTRTLISGAVLKRLMLFAGGKRSPWPAVTYRLVNEDVDRIALAEFEFFVECALDGYKEQAPGRPGNSWLDRETLAELFTIADQWDIRPATAEAIMAKCQGRRDGL